MIQFMFFLHKTGKSYSCINTHKAMLLQTLPLLGNKWCNSCNLITRFMKGIYRQKPPLPRYHFTWDVCTVLKYLSSLFPLEKLSLKLLTFKLVALLALSSAPRAQTLAYLNLDYMCKETSVVSFMFPHLLKTSRIGHSFVLKVEHFRNESLCVFHTLEKYIEQTCSLRKSRFLFISYKTYKAISTCTIARWLRTVLELSGIDTSIFKAHSFRGASVSAAFRKGCSVNLILSTADWSTDKNFKKFYHRQPLSNKQLTFAQAVLQ